MACPAGLYFCPAGSCLMSVGHYGQVRRTMPNSALASRVDHRMWRLWVALRPCGPVIKRCQSARSTGLSPYYPSQDKRVGGEWFGWRSDQLADPAYRGSRTQVASETSIEPTRRDFLYIATSGFAAVGTAAVVWPLISQMSPDASTLALA